MTWPSFEMSARGSSASPRSGPDKAELHEDPEVAAKDRADMEILAQLGTPAEGDVFMAPSTDPTRVSDLPHRTSMDLKDDPDTRAIVLVEGTSDRLALEELARRRGRDLGAEGISVVPMGGAGNIGAFLDLYGPGGRDVGLAGLCDVRQEDDVRRALERAGFGVNLTRAEMERLGFFACIADLEDELIRSVGAATVERIIDTQGELESFRTFQRQPAWRERTIEQQLRRFIGTHSGRKIRLAPLLVDALDLDQVPRPLDRLLIYV
jgi:OLD-like protein